MLVLHRFLFDMASALNRCWLVFIHFSRDGLLGQTTVAGFSLLPQEIKGWGELAQNEGVVVEERDPVGQVEDDEDGRRDVEGANVDVVAQLGRRRSASLLERRQLHLVLLPLLLRRRRR